MVPKICSIPECEKGGRIRRGWCSMHYSRWRSNGDPSLSRADATDAERFWPKVRKGGECWEWTAHIDVSGYGTFRHDGQTTSAHRVSYILANGHIPENLEVDHICHNRACVNPIHLRVVTRKQNNENRSGASRNNGTGVRGVGWVEKRGKWRAYVCHDGQYLHVGYFTSLAEAEAAAIAKRNEVFTHNNLDRIAA